MSCSPARPVGHRKLAALGPKGDYATAEGVVQEMARSGYPPGPRAYHALVFSHLKGGSVEGALESIRREVKAGERAWGCGELTRRAGSVALGLNGI